MLCVIDDGGAGYAGVNDVGYAVVNDGGAGYAVVDDGWC